MTFVFAIGGGQLCKSLLSLGVCGVYGIVYIITSAKLLRERSRQKARWFRRGGRVDLRGSFVRSRRFVASLRAVSVLVEYHGIKIKRQ